VISRVARQIPQERIPHDIDQKFVMLQVGAIEPRKRAVVVPAKCVYPSDAARIIFGMQAYKTLQCPIGVVPSAQGVEHQRRRVILAYYEPCSFSCNHTLIRD
jgi:hypothetical protein